MSSDSNSKTRSRNSDADFVKAYQAAESVAQVANELGITENSVNVRASKLRKLGVELKSFPRKERITQEYIQNLNDLANQSS